MAAPAFLLASLMATSMGFSMALAQIRADLAGGRITARDYPEV